MSATAPTAGMTLLDDSALRQTTDWIASHQQASGEILWKRDGKSDPWDLVHAAMGLCAMGRTDAALAAYRYMASIQDADGAWAAERVAGVITRQTQESNHAAYIATGVWQLYLAERDRTVLQELWPMVRRAIDWVVGLQLPSGAMAWAKKKGHVWQAPLVTGSSSIHGSLVCALHIAGVLGHERPSWRTARTRLARLLRSPGRTFHDTDLPEPPGRYSMDWYYPVLAGAVRGTEGRKRLLDGEDHGDFMQEGVGTRCVRENPWYTVAETSELVLALDAVGLRERAQQVLSWTHTRRTEDGAYWTGTTHPEGIVFPSGETTTWTAATVLIAHDAVHRATRTSELFRSLSGKDLEARTPLRPQAYADGPTPAE